ncbi:MAG: PKD domain-containing protein, partial [Bacteroidetes bacterium]|nr:PKD domain-containing protein [Bacteroidota bacterium]
MKPKHFMKSAVIVLLALMNQLSFAQQQTKITCTTSVPFQPQSAVIATDPIGQSGCEGTDLFFFVETTGDAPITYQWQLFNGAAWVNISNVGAYSGTDADTFRITGLQTAFGGNNYRCVISNGCGDDTSSAGVLTVNPLPVANAGADASIVMGETASLTGIAANYTSILWSSTGDGNFSLPGNLSTTYSPGPSDSIAGEVMLVLQATSSCGVSTDTIVLTITQLQIDCHAEFTAEYSGGNTVLLTNSSTGDLGMMFWDFGDGVFMNETQQSFSHSYTNPGFYTICLTTFDSITNCQDDTCISIEIDSLVPNCSAIFQFTNLAGNAIAFDGSQSQGSLTSYQWEFGDGSVSFAISPTHSFPASGYYNVTLVVYDSINNCMSQYERVVAAGSPANDCAAEFTYYSELTNKTVHFVSVSQGQNVDQVLWNFGDGSFATQPDTSHIFQTSAFYNVCLSVLSSTTGCANITCRTIKVGDDDHSCHASFVYAVDSTYSKSASGRKVDFKGTAFGDPAKSVWS